MQIIAIRIPSSRGRMFFGPVHALAGFVGGHRIGDPQTACGLTLPRDSTYHEAALMRVKPFRSPPLCGDCAPLLLA